MVKKEDNKSKEKFQWWAFIAGALFILIAMPQMYQNKVAAGRMIEDDSATIFVYVLSGILALVAGFLVEKSVRESKKSKK